MPSSWYEFGLHGPEDDCAGAGHPGLPGMWWGSNGTMAWTITNNAASARDLYREEIAGTRYRDGGEWRELAIREESIPVRGAAPHALTVRATSRGPIINALIPALEEGGDPPLSLRWVGAEHIDDMRAMIAVGRAKDRDAMRDALRDWAVAVFNFVYADRSGNVGYQMAGRVPVRGRITYGFRDAANAADAWRGYVPFDDLPQSFNPARGYVASANQRVVPPSEKLPLYGAYSQGHRGARIDAAFAPPAKLDHDANVAFQNDVKSARAERMVPHILGHLRGAEGDAALVATLLEGWDCRYTLDSVAATVFETVMTHWQRKVLSRDMPARLLDLAVQQTGLGVAILEGDEPGFFAEGTKAAPARCRRCPASPRCGRSSVRTARPGNGAGCMSRTGSIRRRRRARAGRSISARRRWMAARTRCATPAGSCRRIMRARGRNTGSWWISPCRTASSPCRISAIPACRAARITATSSSPGCAANTTPSG